MARQLTVLLHGHVVGHLTLNEYGEPSFTYAEDWLERNSPYPISASLPLQSEAFDRRASLPFFEGLLPEATQRTAVARALGVSERNEFRLLAELGGEVAGAVEIWPDGTEPTQPSDDDSKNKKLGEDALVHLIERLPTRPMLAGGEDGLRLSLAGAQAKLPVIYANGEISLPTAGEPTTHILKPEIPGFDGTAENEAFCMRLASAIGLTVASVEYREIDDKRFLLVKRYDRQKDDHGQTIRLHQEDFCQALGFTSAQKYARDGGPVFRDCFQLLRRVATKPAAETLKLLDAALFNAIIGNAGAHGKNFSLLYKRGLTELAPLYDLLSTVAYSCLSQRFAMKFGGRRTLEEMYPADIIIFAKEIEIRAPFVRRRMYELAEAILDKAGMALEGLELSKDRAKIAGAYVDTIKARAEATRKMIPSRLR
mgnify:FL=1